MCFFSILSLSFKRIRTDSLIQSPLQRKKHLLEATVDFSVVSNYWVTFPYLQDLGAVSAKDL